MRKRLLLVALLIVSQVNALFAQGGLFDAPDTVCAKQLVHLKSNVPNSATHYWGFCSAYTLNNATGINMGHVTDNQNPNAIEIAKDGDNYYGFVLSTDQRSFLRLDFGKSLANTPKVTNYGNMDSVLPYKPASLYIVKDSAKNNWHIFVSGGEDATNSTLARIDYGHSLSNIPNIVNFGNYNNILANPVGVFVAKEDTSWYGFVLNRFTNKLVRIDFGSNISYTPSLVDDIGGPAVNAFIFTPNDMTVAKENGLWYFFFTNEATSTVGLIQMGNTLTNTAPTAGSVGNAAVIDFGDNPTGITYLKDCDSMHLFVTKKATHELVRIDMDAPTGPYRGTNFSKFAGMLSPGALSQFMRDRDNIYCFVPNVGDTTVSRINLLQCQNANIQFSTTNQPPAYSYDSAGLYNIYYAVNEGQPDMQIQCKLIRVLPIPPMLVTNDTAICQGDTIGLRIISVNALSFTWTPNYNISSTSQNQVIVWPRYSTTYHVTMPFPHGCIVDTNLHVTVNKVNADAGPDRTLKDGETTILGGPYTSLGPIQQYFYVWSPNQFLSDRYSLNPTANPPYDFTYYLTVTDSSNCVSVDTVVVHVDCNDLNLPNAFMPESVGSTARFGLSNSQIVKLNSFTIYDRWGVQVFSTKDATHQWDGKVNGKDAPMGVYVWEADGFCTSGKRFSKSGNVTLVR